MFKQRRTGWTHTVEWKAWYAMMQRCINKDHPSYKDYGGRGITVSEAWQDPLQFLRDMYPKPHPTYSLDRRDNDGNYEKSNCRWASKLMQAHNRRPRHDKKSARVQE